MKKDTSKLYSPVATGKRAAKSFGFSRNWQICLVLIFAVVALAAILGGGAFTPQSAAQENDSVASLAPAAQFCNTNPISITGILSSGKASPYPSNITVSGLNGVVSNVTLTLNNIQHTFGRDIDILLVGPNGENFVVMSDVGQADGLDNPVTLTISDSGATQFTNLLGAIPSGTYKPTNHSDALNPDVFESPAPVGPYNHPAPTGSATFASVFNNHNPNGTWSLYVMDDSSSNSGSISGWCLDITTAPPPANQLQFAAANFNGNANTTATVTVNRENAAPGAVSVNYATTDGSATGGGLCGSGIDYIVTGGTLNFADGETSKTFPVQICPNTSAEPNETINLTLSNPTGGAILGIQPTATLTILAPGTPATQFCNANAINIPVGNSGVLPYPANINVSGMNGVVNKVTVTLNGIQHSWAENIDVLLVSPTGRKFVLMSDVGEQHGFDNPTTITLTDAATGDLLNTNFRIDSGSYKPTNLEIDDVFPSPAPAGPYNQPARAGFSTFANVFNNLNPNGTWSLYVSDDSAAAGGSIAGGWCMDIVSGAPVTDNIQFAEPNFNRAAGATANIVVQRPNTSAGAVSVNYATTNGTAVGGASCDSPGVDYVSTSGTLNFADGETGKTVNVQLCTGEASEPPETINLALSNPTGGAVIGTPGAATVTIYNGDLPCNVTWRKVDSPHVIGGTRTLFNDEIVCVEPGAVVQFVQNGKINLYGEIRALGTETDRIQFTSQNVSPNRVELAGKMDLRFVDVAVPLNVNQGGSLIARDSNFIQHGTINTFFGIVPERKPRFVSLENVVFDSNNPVQSDNAQLYATSLYLLLKNVTFKNSAFFNVSGSVVDFDTVKSENNAYEGFTFSQGGMIQPTLLESLSATNCTRAGLRLDEGNFFIDPTVTIQNCEYTISGKGGLMPGSTVPASGNRNNWIEVGQPGGAVTYAPVGIPYVVQDFSDIAQMEFLPGAHIKARPSFQFNTGSAPLRALGLPGAPIIFEPFAPGQRWDGGQFNFNGNRMEYVILDGMQNGVISAGGTGGSYYIENSIFRNNNLGVYDRIDSNGAALLQSNLFTNNVTAIKAERAGIVANKRSNPNLFENNQVAVNSTSVPDVRNNWWNSPTGPTKSDNPGGTGDVINGGARYRPFLTTRPDTTDHPPVVRMPRGAYNSRSQGWLEPGRKIIIHWDAFDDHSIVKQKILFSTILNGPGDFTKIADNLPPGQRSFELTVPSVGAENNGIESFLRIVAVDDKGQEGWDEWMLNNPSGVITGELVITSDVAGKTFRAGDEIPFTFQITQPFNVGLNVSRYLILDADRKILPYGANTIAIMPPVSTDSARLMILVENGLNHTKYFYSEPFSIRYDPRYPDTPPQISLTSPAAGQQFPAGSVIPITWTATDNESIRHFNIQTSSDGGRSWIQIAENLPPTTTSYNWQPEARSVNSDIRVRVVAVDRRYQNSSDGAQRVFGIVAPPSAPPTVQVTFPANNAVYTVGQSTFIAANAADPDGVIQRVEFYAKGSAYPAQADATLIGSDTTAPYQVAWNYPSAQGYVVTARAYDNRNQLVNSAPVNVTFNPFNPAPLPIAPPELTNPVDGATFAAPANITLEALPAPTNRTIVRVEFYNGTTLVGTDTTAPYSLTLNNLPAGKYTFFVKSVADNNAESVSAVTDVSVGNAAEIRRTRYDFDGDGRADIGVYRGGNWYVQQSTTGFSATQFGVSTDKLVPADYDGDGKTDIAVYRDGIWYLLRSTAGFTGFQFGQTGDIPQTGDFDADGKADFAVFRPSDGYWYVQQSTAGFAALQFGANGDKPVAADYDGDGKTDAAVYRPTDGTWYVLQSRDGFRAIQFGIATDKPATGDFDGDGKADFAVYRDGVWYLQRSQTGFTAVQFGIASDVPVAADYDGDGKTDMAVFRDGTWYLLQSTAGFAGAQFGQANDVPVSAVSLP